MTSDQLKIAQGYTDAWNAHDPDAVASFYSDRGQISINGGEPSRGSSEIAAMAQAFFDDLPDLHLTMDGFRTSGTHAVYLWTFVGTYTDANGPGNRVKVSGWEYWTLEADGKIAASMGHFDADDYQRQISGH